MKILKLISALLVSFTIPLSGIVAEESWVLIDGPNKIERGTQVQQYPINFFKNKSLFATFYQLSHSPNNGAGSYLSIPSLNTLIYLPFYPTPDGRIYTHITTRERLSKVELGTPKKISAEVTITQMGNIKIFGHILTRAGFAMINSEHPKLRGQGMMFLVAPFSPKTPASPSPQLIENMKEAIDFLSTKDSTTFYPLGELQTNYSDSTTESLVETRSTTINCQPVPECCCTPEEIATDGKCYAPTVVAVGGFGGMAGLETIKERTDSEPCMANTVYFTYDNSKCVSELGKEFANLVNDIKNQCGNSPVDIRGYCYGGNIAALSMATFDQAGKYQISTYSTGWQGTFRIYNFLNDLSFGIVGFFMQKPIKDLMQNCVDKPGPVPSWVTKFDNYMGTSDHDFPDSSLASSPAGANNIEDPEGGHYDTITRNFKYRYCCGDGKVQVESENCDPEGSDCDLTLPNNIWVVPGECNNSCQCAPIKFCGDGILDTERGEQCEPPGKTILSFCKTQITCSRECKEIYDGPPCPAPSASIASAHPIGNSEQ
jgi:hypothetical protein